jgi:hypothetical protein
VGSGRPSRAWGLPELVVFGLLGERREAGKSDRADSAKSKFELERPVDCGLGSVGDPTLTLKFGVDESESGVWNGVDGPSPAGEGKRGCGIHGSWKKRLNSSIRRICIDLSFCSTILDSDVLVELLNIYRWS